MNQGSNKKAYSAPADPQVISVAVDAASSDIGDPAIDGGLDYSSQAG